MFLLGPRAEPVFSASDLVSAAGCPCANLCVPGGTPDAPQVLGRFTRLCRRGLHAERS